MDIKKIKSFKTEEGIFSTWGIDRDLFTVWENPKGWIIRNMLIPEGLRRQGLAFNFHKKMNILSYQKTGVPLQTVLPRKVGDTFLREFSDEAEKLWEYMVDKGLAVKIDYKRYMMKPPVINESTQEIINPSEKNRTYFNTIPYRRFIYNVKNNILVLGGNNINWSSHAEEWQEAGFSPLDFDTAVRGWVAGGNPKRRSYRSGIIHFAPRISEYNYDEGYTTLKMFKKLGATNYTIIRQFLKPGEEKLGNIIMKLKERVLQEITYQDAYGPEFVKFVNKWKGKKKDKNYFVQFSNHNGDYTNKAPYADPNHADPVGVYGYPLWYVIDYPGDIWYGQKAKFLRVLWNKHPEKTLQLQYVGYNDANNFLNKLHISDGRFETTQRKLKHTGISADAKTFFSYIQLDIPKFNKTGEKVVRPGMEQTKFLRQLGFYAIEDRAERYQQAVINEREPNQICFLTPVAFEVIDSYQLNQKQTGAFTYNEPSDEFLRSLVNRIATEVFNDRLVRHQLGTYREYPINYSNTWWTAGGRRIELNVASADNHDRKLGQKPYRQWKKYDWWYIDVSIYCEYDDIEYRLNTDNSINEFIRDMKEDLAADTPNKDWIPDTRENYEKGIKTKHDKWVQDEIKKRNEGFIEDFYELKQYLETEFKDETIYSLVSRITDDERIDFIQNSNYAIQEMMNYTRSVKDNEKNYHPTYEEFISSSLGKQWEDYVVKEGQDTIGMSENISTIILKIIKHLFDVYSPKICLAYAVRANICISLMSIQRELEEKGLI
jgi:hypothetical protein